MTKIEIKCKTRSIGFTEAQLDILKAKAKSMTLEDIDPQEYYHALSLLLLTERDHYLYGREDKRLTTGDIK